MNPFWSERIRGEAILRSLRPKSLPPAVERGRGREGRGLPAMALKARPEEDEAQENRPRGSMNVESVMALVLQQNSELQKEVFALPMATGGFPPVCMVPPLFVTTHRSEMRTVVTSATGSMTAAQPVSWMHRW